MKNILPYLSIMLAFAMLCFGSFTAIGQSVSIKSALGNGSNLSGLKTTDAKTVGNLEGSSTLHPATGSNRDS